MYIHICKILDARFAMLSVMHLFQSVVQIYALQASDSPTHSSESAGEVLELFSIILDAMRLLSSTIHPFEALGFFMYNLRLTNKACSWHMAASHRAG